MQIVYHGPHGGVYVALGDGREVYVERGEEVEFAASLAEALLQQPANWKRAAAKAKEAGKEKS